MQVEHIPRSSGVYVIVNTANGKRYVGSSKDMRTRAIRHRASLRAGKHSNDHLQRSWGEHGASAFVFEVVELVERVDLLAREQHYMDTWRVTDHAVGFNILPFAGRPVLTPEVIAKIVAARAGWKMSDQQRKKLSESSLSDEAKIERLRALGRSNAGKKASDETRAKLSAARAGKSRGPQSEAMKARLSAAKIGKPVPQFHTPEARAAQSRALKTSPKAIEQRARAHKARIGYRHSEESKQKMRETKARRRIERATGGSK